MSKRELQALTDENYRTVVYKRWTDGNAGESLESMQWTQTQETWTHLRDESWNSKLDWKRLYNKLKRKE